MAGELKRVALVAMHTSPAAPPGTGDSGGMNVALLALAGHLASRGIEVDLLTRATSAPETRALSPGVRLCELAAGGPGELRKERLPEAADEFGEAVAELAGRASTRYDLIHAHYWLSGLATLPVAIELGLPFVQTFHTIGAMKNRHRAPGESLEPELRLRTEEYLAGQASAVVAVSAAEATSLIDDVRAPADRIWVIPPGVDVDLFAPREGDAAIRERFGIRPGRPILTVVGRVQPLKDQELAILALAELRAGGEAELPVLVIAGEATPGSQDYLAGLRRLAARTGVGDSVLFAGALPRRELAELLSAASLTLVPSHSETFCLVALESAASGTPVLGFRGTGLLESVAEGVSGRLIDSRDPKAWAIEIAGLLSDRTRLAALSASARRHADAFTWRAAAASMIGLYRSLL